MLICYKHQVANATDCGHLAETIALLQISRATRMPVRWKGRLHYDVPVYKVAQALLPQRRAVSALERYGTSCGAQLKEGDTLCKRTAERRCSKQPH